MQISIRGALQNTATSAVSEAVSAVMRLGCTITGVIAGPPAGAIVGLSLTDAALREGRTGLTSLPGTLALPIGAAAGAVAGAIIGPGLGLLLDLGYRTDADEPPRALVSAVRQAA